MDVSILRIPKLWRGLLLTGQCGRPKSLDWMDRWIAGELFATTSMSRSATEVLIVKQNSFVQSYGATALDASLLLIPIVGFLPASDPRVRGTLAAIEAEPHSRRLCAEVSHQLPEPTDCRRARARFSHAASGSPTIMCFKEGIDEARELFDRLLSLRNDVGLARRGIRCIFETSVGQFSAGIFTSRADQYRA